MKIRIGYIIISLLVCFVYSCKKEEDAANPLDFGQGTGHCRLQQVVDHQISPADSAGTYLSYDSSGRIAYISLPGNTSYEFFEYGAGFIRISHLNATFQEFSYDTLKLSAEGLLLSRISTHVGFPADPEETFQYDAQKQLIVHFYPPANGQVNGASQYFKWANGDIIQDSLAGSSTEIHNYTYTDKPSQYAGAHVFDGLVTFGLPVYRTRHLEQSVGRGDITRTKYAYTFDNEGKVMTDSIEINGITSSYRTFRYECR